mgnify:CR=1 FL=1
MKIVDTNVFLVLRGTLGQWLTYALDLAKIPSDQILTIKTPKSVTRELAEEVQQGKYRYIFVTDNSYREFSSKTACARLTYQRFIIDEADSLHVPSFTPLKAMFTWFVTANYDNLSRQQTPTVFIRRLFLDTYDRSFLRYGDVKNELVVRSADSFVHQSLQLPPMKVRTVLVRTSYLISSLRNHVSSEVMEAIYACDVETATLKLGCSATYSEDGLVSAITERYKREIDLLNVTMRTAPIASLQTLQQRVKETEQKIENIVQRVRQVECCPISLDDIQVKAVTPCCHNAFEFRCIVQALQRCARCPMCKKSINGSDLIVKAHEDGDETRQLVPEDRKTTPFRNKQEAVNHVLTEVLRDPNAKVLVFSSYNMENVIDRMRAVLGNEMREIKGTTSAIDKYISEFRDGRLRVLLLNVNHFGVGLNLECATHIITLHNMHDDRYHQLIGRAQRPGRTIPLSVMNVRYEGE